MSGRRAAVFLVAVSTAWSYFPLDTMRPNIHRADCGNIQFLVNQEIAPGLTNADGATWITADSDPLQAIDAALATWNGVSTSSARFLPARTTSSANNPGDRQSVIVFADNADTRSILGSGVLALTLVVYSVPDGAVLDSDIVFNPGYTFSTSFARGTVDLQAVMTHELGHALGANHTTVLGATMYQATPFNDNHQSSLSSDDIAFVSANYPARGGNGNGTLRGTATLGDGSAIHGGLVVALDASTGITVSGLSSLADGTFEFQAPPGNYLVYVEPVAGYVRPGNLNIPSNAIVDTNFQSSFLGGNDSPSTVNLTAGATVSVDLQAAAGVAAFASPYLATGMAGGANDAASFYQAPLSVSSGQVIDLLICGRGLDALDEQSLRIVGAGVGMRAGSFRTEAMQVGGWPVYRVTLDVLAAASHSVATIVVRSGGMLATLTGVMAIGQPQIVNADSRVGGMVTPGEMATYFGQRVGPSPPAVGELDAAGMPPLSVGDVSVAFDGVPAPVFYAGPNQVSFLVPDAVAGKAFTTVVTTYLGRTSGQFTIPVQNAAQQSPYIF